MDTFIVKFGPRIKKVEVALEEPFSFKYVLERAIRKLMECDPFMKNRASSGFFMTQYSEQSKLSIEIDDATKYWDIDPNLPIELMLFESINFEIPTRKTTEPAALPTTADPITPSVLSYMDKLGLVVHHDPALVTPSPTAVTRGAGTSTAAAAPKSTPAARAHNSRSSNTPSSSKTAVCDSSKPSTSNPSTSNPSTSGQILYSPQPSRKKKSRVAQSDDESDGEGEYLERVLQRREQNRAVLEQLVPSDAPKLRPATRKQGKKKGKENIEPRIMPSRAAKQKVPSANENQTGDDEEMEEQERISQEDTLINDGPIASHSGRKTVQVNVVGNFHKKKNHKLIGTVITKATPLPEFPKALKGSLERGIYNTRQMNAFLKSHVANISKDRKGQITKAEYKNLSVQVTNRFASMNFAHADTYRLKIKKSSATV
ncbi:uncharacterized protein LOC117653801 [Thrips palmi]|uniref:Uncharacterized protein LOC117653801 n=1 Tax=Thrips palmi TaxID=161013 RepID=A0A6P9AE08_THRPL|nr:uncharacterized protein LOC117653801 [Thrips palmi]